VGAFDDPYIEQFKNLKKRVFKTMVSGLALLLAGFLGFIFADKLGLPEDGGMYCLFGGQALFFLMVGVAVAMQRCPNCKGFLLKQSVVDGVHTKCGTRLIAS